jgi:hypothetical protein
MDAFLDLTYGVNEARTGALIFVADRRSMLSAMKSEKQSGFTSNVTGRGGWNWIALVGCHQETFRRI